MSDWNLAKYISCSIHIIDFPYVLKKSKSLLKRYGASPSSSKPFVRLM